VLQFEQVGARRRGARWPLAPTRRACCGRGALPVATRPWGRLSAHARRPNFLPAFVASQHPSLQTSQGVGVPSGWMVTSEAGPGQPTHYNGCVGQAYGLARWGAYR
jgi:hypothetical protein